MPSGRKKPVQGLRSGKRQRLDLNAALSERGAKPGRSPKRSTSADPLEPAIDPASPWYIEPVAFPLSASQQSQLEFCVRCAVLAPSSHNAQPWKFRVRASGVEVYADRTRALPVVDPQDRELIISCGCALYTLRLAMRRLMAGEVTTLLPDHTKPDLLAVVNLPAAAGKCSPHEFELYRAIARRRTTRLPFDISRIPSKEQLGLIKKAAENEGALLHVIDAERDRTLLAKLIAEADHVQFASAAFRRELALWLHHNRTHSADGIPGYALGMQELESLIAPLVIRTFDIGRSTGAKHEDLVLHSPVLVGIASATDDPRGWLAAGQGLAAALLEATVHGYTASYLNQPVEIPALRPRVGKILGEPFPQLLLRIGHAPTSAHTPRRPLADVLVRSSIAPGKRR